LEMTVTGRMPAAQFRFKLDLQTGHSWWNP
jgi:hypothetical protein